jgi:hypothetical protein
LSEEEPVEDKEEESGEGGECELVEDVTEPINSGVSIKIEHIKNKPGENLEKETLKEKLAKATGKVYKWMAGIEPNEIGPTIEEWDKLSLLKMVEMADQEIREHPQKFI